MKRILPFVVAALLVTQIATATAQKSERDSALALYDAGKDREAIAIFERLAVSTPNDITVLERLGFAIIRNAGTLPDAAARKTARARARAFFAKAVAAGTTNTIVKGIVEVMPEDGGIDAVFSKNPAVDSAMQTAETAYAAKDFRAAFTWYQKALALDPMNYEAAMFSGDVYVHVPPVDSAYVWYARAVEINPHRETAWRYWSDVLTKNGKSAEALDKAIEAAVAEPYGRTARQALSNWATSTRTPLGVPKAPTAADTIFRKSPAGIAYDSVRKAWKGSDGSLTNVIVTTMQTGGATRHSLAEERAALRAAVKAGNGAPEMANLKAMDDAGVLDAFILFFRADAGIAEDYAEYVRTNRPMLKRFWADFVVGAKYSR